MSQNRHTISRNARVSVAEEDDKYKYQTYYDYFITIDRPGETVEIGIPEDVYEDFVEAFDDIER